MRMRKSASGSRVLSAFVLTATLSAGIATPTLASCMEIPLPEPTARRAVVFIGTVADADEERTLVEVEAWYLGDDPTESVVVMGGLMYPGGEYETSVDWERRQGERYAVVAERSPDGTLQTEVCLQQLVDGRTLSRLTKTYGSPSVPPFVAVPTARPLPSIPPTEAPLPTDTPAQTAAPSAPDALPPADLIEPPAGAPEVGLSQDLVAMALVLAAAAFFLTILAARRHSPRS